MGPALLKDEGVTQLRLAALPAYPLSDPSDGSVPVTHTASHPGPRRRAVVNEAQEPPSLESLVVR